MRQRPTVEFLSGDSSSCSRTRTTYLHDTPARMLFSRSRVFARMRSSRTTCRARGLLLGGQGWTPDRIQATVNTGQQTVVNLKTPIPVTISYATAFRTPDGLLHYRRDVYGRDRKLLAALARRSQGAWEE